MAQVLCKDCGWEGNLDELVFDYTTHKVVCPECGNPDLEEPNEISTEIPI